MAGDWIKMRGNLWDDPRVARLCDMTDAGEAAIVGALYWLWATADQHSQDGVMPGLTLRAIDRKTGVPGFASAMVSIGWLGDDPAGVVVIHFEEHNGESAKRRSVDAQRKANVRKVSDKHRTEDGQTPDEIRRSLELEKEKEKELTTKAKSKAEAVHRATRLPADWQPTDVDVEYCKAKRPDLQALVVAEGFRDYWIGSGKTKADWPATWRVWVSKEKGTQARAGPGKPEKFDPLTYMKNQREAKAKNERTIEFDTSGEPI